MAKTVAAIVGRPNVGKSTLFNKIAGTRVSIVDDSPGVTRDRVYYETDWNGKPIVLIDTGGIEPKTDNTLLQKMRLQAQIAIETADVIVFLCDINAGVTADDKEIAHMLQRSKKPIILAVNKIDSIGEPPLGFYEFYELGLGDPIAVSSVHGTGTGDILDSILEKSPVKEEEEEDNESIKIAVMGKPNAGKSSLVNNILGEERMIVSDMAGTTRDAIDNFVENKYGKFTIIDTAGIRRKSKVVDKIEKYSVLRAREAAERADVCLIMIDGTEGITEQDEKIAGIAHEAGKASIIVVNKWDIVEKDNSTVKKFTDDIYKALSYMTYAPIVFVSAKTGQRVDRIFELAVAVSSENSRRITTGMLNDVLADAQTRVQPPTDKGKRLKIYYMTQSGVNPPTFVIFVNSAELFHFSYQRYIENKIREAFGFNGTPIRFVIRQKGDDEV